MTDQTLPRRSDRHKRPVENGPAQNTPAPQAPQDASPEGEGSRLSRRSRAVLISVLAVVVVLLLAVFADLLIANGKIHPGVTVGEVAVGGLTVPEASGEIASFVADRATASVTVSAAEASWEVAASDIGFSVDATGLAESAFAVGRGSLGEAIVDRVTALINGVDLPMAVSCDDERFNALIASMNQLVASPPIDAAILIDGVDVSRTDAQDGTGISVETARDAVLPAFLSENRRVELTLETLPAAIDRAATDDAYAATLAMLSGPLTLFYEDHEWDVPTTTLAGWIGFRTAETSATPVLEAYIVAEKVAEDLTPMVEDIGQAAQDASFSVSNGHVTIVPAKNGLAADPADLAMRLTGVLASTADRRAELTMRSIEPELTTAEAEAMGIKERLGTFTTDFDSSNKPRVHNIHLLADTLDGTLVAPGEVFSFNDTTGERTAAKGYQAAGAIVSGEIVPQIGGGICQVGTTVFNAVFFSGLPVVERRNHSLYISHYPKGRDATINWGGPDFKFKNDTDHYVLVATSHTAGSITVSIYGTNPGYTVTYDTGPWTNVIPPTVKTVEDDTLPVGARVVESTGQSGRTIVVTRHVLLNGTEVRTDTFKSVYRATQEVVRVGTMVVESEPATTTP